MIRKGTGHEPETFESKKVVLWQELQEKKLLETVQTKEQEWAFLF